MAQMRLMAHGLAAVTLRTTKRRRRLCARRGPHPHLVTATWLYKLPGDVLWRRGHVMYCRRCGAQVYECIDVVEPTPTNHTPHSTTTEQTDD